MRFYTAMLGKYLKIETFVVYIDENDIIFLLCTRRYKRKQANRLFVYDHPGVCAHTHTRVCVFSST